MIRHPSFATFAVLLAAFLCGCTGRRDSDYLPPADNARKAVQAALDAWKSGAPHAPLTGDKVAIHVYDDRWRDGKKLEKFEIGEPAADESPPRFPVKMQLVGEAEVLVNYLVIGIDPLNVFREEDYQKASGM